MALAPHGGDCDGTWCPFCGCCGHGEREGGCFAAEAPVGMSCPESGCGCDGQGYYEAPEQTPLPVASDVDDRTKQLHQETSLFDLA